MLQVCTTKRLADEWAEHTKLHGPLHIKRSPNCAIRFFYIWLLLCVIGAGIYLTYFIMIDYYESAVGTSYQIINMGDSKNLKPLLQGALVCHSNWLDRKAVRDLIKNQGLTYDLLTYAVLLLEVHGSPETGRGGLKTILAYNDYQSDNEQYTAFLKYFVEHQTGEIATSAIHSSVMMYINKLHQQLLSYLTIKQQHLNQFLTSVAIQPEKTSTIEIAEEPWILGPYAMRNGRVCHRLDQLEVPFYRPEAFYYLETTIIDDVTVEESKSWSDDSAFISFYEGFLPELMHDFNPSTIQESVMALTAPYVNRFYQFSFEMEIRKNARINRHEAKCVESSKGWRRPTNVLKNECLQLCIENFLQQQFKCTTLAIYGLDWSAPCSFENLVGDFNVWKSTLLAKKPLSSGIIGGNGKDSSSSSQSESAKTNATATVFECASKCTDHQNCNDYTYRFNKVVSSSGKMRYCKLDANSTAKCRAMSLFIEPTDVTIFEEIHRRTYMNVVCDLGGSLGILCGASFLTFMDALIMIMRWCCECQGRGGGGGNDKRHLLA